MEPTASTDRDLVARLLARDETALREIGDRYSHYLRAIAGGILHDPFDVEEVLNDTLLGAWDSIPPHEPEDLKTYLGKLCRRASIDRLRVNLAGRRGGGIGTLSLDELSECIPDGGDFREDLLTSENLGGLIDAFLRRLPEREQIVFLRRYWYFDSTRDIAERFGIRETRVRVMLFRTRRKLREYLEQGGIVI